MNIHSFFFLRNINRREFQLFIIFCPVLFSLALFFFLILSELGHVSAFSQTFPKLSVSYLLKNVRNYPQIRSHFRRNEQRNLYERRWSSLKRGVDRFFGLGRSPSREARPLSATPYACVPWVIPPHVHTWFPAVRRRTDDVRRQRDARQSRGAATRCDGDEVLASVSRPFC